MKIIDGEIPGLKIIYPTVFKDERGLFFESFNQKVFNEAIGKEVTFVQDNESVSKKNVIRGLHLQQKPSAQGKLVRVAKGSVLDVAVDVRVGSPFYGMFQMIELSEENGVQFWIPEGFAHGFIALEEGTKFLYKCTSLYDKSAEVCIKWNDEHIGVKWGRDEVIVSEKDQEGVAFVNYQSNFVYE